MRARTKYLVGLVLVAASYSITKHWALLFPPPEEPMPVSTSGGGILNMHAEDALKAAESMNQGPAPPSQK